jgi:hypothetical protein
MSKIRDNRIVNERLTDDRRGSCRMPQPGSGYGTAELRIHKKTVTVDVLDESAGGFMVAADKIPKTQATNPVELTNDSGRHALRVVWRRTVHGKTRMGLQRLSEELVWRQESSWFVWMLCAIILGFGIGYVVAFRDQDGLANRIVELSTRRALVNEMVDDQPIPSPVDDN